MSIATKLAELSQIRANIRTALNGKGIDASDHNFADFATDIDDIQTGGGVSDVLTPAVLPQPVATITIT